MIHAITENEFWKFWGIIIVARIEGRKGEKLWDRLEPEGYGRKIDMSPYIKQHCFKEIKKYIPYLFSKEEDKQHDPWWQFASAIDAYNENRSETLCSSLTKIFDETMSAFRPRTTKRGNLPHLSKIDRKPEPLGTELKATNSSKIGMGLFLEIQRGKVEMDKQNYTRDMIKTAVCSVRMAEGTASATVEEREEKKFDVYLGDSWFALVECAAQLFLRCNALFIGIVKTNHARYPKKFLENKMKDWPPGSHLLLESTYKGVNLFACGYKYNKKNCCFIFTKGSGHTQEGQCYEENGKT